MHPGRTFATLACALALFLAACGGDGDTSDTSSGADSGDVTIEMVDIAFEPKEIEVAAGEEITFRFENAGKLPHDAFIGDREAQTEHADDMKKGEDAHGAHGGDDEGITVEPGDTGTLTYTFDEPGRYEIGCHQPGHYEAGMKVAVVVA